MAEFKISVDLSEVISAGRDIITAETFPFLNQAIRTVAQQTKINWLESIEHARLWRGEKDAYKATIQWQMLNDFEALVWADYKYAEEIEQGRPPKDLKRMLNTSLKVRASQKGNRYLIIPFQHNTPSANATGQAMPDDIYDMAKMLSPSFVTGQTQRISGTGAYDIRARKRLTVNQNIYKWGGSLEGDSIPNRFAGMRRFDTSAGGARRSTYLTFRAMSEKSSGWIVPAKPGLFLAKTVAEAMQPKAIKVFQEAIRRTI
nr:hypothetical protein [Nitrosomonas nitrosa]